MPRLTSSAFEDGEPIPERYTCDDAEDIPPLVWSGVPADARSLVLVCVDPDAPRGAFYHWGVYDMPPDLSRPPSPGRRSGVNGPHEAVNDFGRTGYGGPCPPRGHGVHHYHFRLYALSVATLSLGPRARCADVERRAREHAIAQAEMVGTYSR